ncbi:CHAT domain-containing protein [Thermodesulfobacteriota bacterium]
MATLWKVEDRSTAEIMVSFYRNLLKGMTKV